MLLLIHKTTVLLLRLAVEFPIINYLVIAEKMSLEINLELRN